MSPIIVFRVPVSTVLSLYCPVSYIIVCKLVVDVRSSVAQATLPLGTIKYFLSYFILSFIFRTQFIGHILIFTQEAVQFKNMVCGIVYFKPSQPFLPHCCV